MKPIILAFVLIAIMDLFPQKVGDAYAININNIYLPLTRTGILADVNISPGGSTGQFGGNTFLFSGGFFLSGYNDGQLWANAVASATLVEDYLQGTYALGQNDPRAQLYKLRSDDIPFGQSWQDWIDAVALGADFYDGNGDGIYNPIDLNGNNEWDENEDHPDLLGDETIWCVYHDAVPSAQRRWNTVEPQGIEIRQTVFAYSNILPLQNIIFIRYRIINTGMVANEMNDVFFGVWDDADLGDHTDDLAGSDTLFNVSYTYNDGEDAAYGNNPPCFSSKWLAGPVTYIPGWTFIDNNGNGKYDEGIDTPLDTADVHRGQLLGITRYPGAQNQKFSSSIDYLNGDPNLRDPDNKEEARNYLLGLNRIGETPDPCTWAYGEVRGGVDCSQVNPFYWYSGDPATNIGWINTYSTDQRQMQNIGPFTLEEGKEIEVFTAYVIGRDTNSVSSVTASKWNSWNAELLYILNFDTSYIVSVEELSTENNPSEYILYQNFPNPFNPSTKIKYSIPPEGTQRAVSVQLKVYDILGNVIATLVNEEQGAGFYEIEFVASQLSSGIYFYQLKAGDFIQTNKMILLK